MASLTECLRKLKFKSEDAKEVRDFVARAGGDEVKGVQAYLDSLMDDAADLRVQLEEQGFDLSPREIDLAKPKNVTTRAKVKPTGEGGADAARVIAGRGGIRDDEGFNLKAGRNMQKFIPGMGYLIRPSGLSIDAAGEALWEEGFFGPVETTPRPSESQVLDLLERGVKSPVYTPEVAAKKNQQTVDQAQDDQTESYKADIRAAAKEIGLTLNDDQVGKILDLVPENNGSVEDALDDYLERDAGDTVAENQNRTNDNDYETEIPFEAFEDDAPQTAQGGDGPAPAKAVAGQEPDAGGGNRQEAGPSRVAPTTERVQTADGQREQFVMPGTEQSARQAAQARETKGRGKIVPKAQQKAADEGLFAPPDNQDFLFSLPRDQQQVKTDTPEFRKWFGDSKVVDKNGKPLVVYHHGSFDENDDAVPKGPMHFGSRDAARERAFGKRVDDAAMAVTAYKADDGSWHWEDDSGLTSEDIGLPGYSSEDSAILYGRAEAVKNNENDDVDESDLGTVTAAYLRIERMKRVPDVGGANGEWDAEIEKAKREGFDGIVYRNRFEDKGSDSYIVFEPTQIKSTNNRGTWDGGDPRIMFSLSQRQMENGPRLSAFHNLSAENLIAADRLGGMPMPSLGVTRSDMPAVDGFGEITMIAGPDIVDPTKTPVFNADAYTQRFPRAEYKKARSAVAQKVVNSFRPYDEKFDDRTRDSLWDYSVNRPDPERIVSDLVRSNAAKAKFLKDTLGLDVEPIMGAATVDLHFVKEKPFQDFLKKHNGKLPQGYDQRDEPIWAEMTKAVSDSIDAQAARMSSEYGKDISASWKKSLIDQDGKFAFGRMIALERSIRNIGKSIVVRSATEERLNQLLKGSESQFKTWVDETVMSMFGEPLVRVGRKLVPYTLENVVQNMKNQGMQASEKTLTFSEGKARAVAASRITSTQEIRNRSTWSMASQAEVNAAREQAKQLTEKYRMAVLDNYNGKNWRGQVDTWNALDASMRALAAAYKRGNTKAALRAALRKEDFSNVSDDTLLLGNLAAKALMESPVPYFEAKPQRAVAIGEFIGAVVPEKADPKVFAILDKHGVPYRTYGESTKRNEILQKFRSELTAQGREAQFSLNKFGITDSVGPVFYSALEREIDGLKFDKAPAAQWAATINSRQNIKKEEVEWSGILDWLETKDGPVTKQEIKEYLDANGVNVTEVLLSDTEETEYDYNISDFEAVEPDMDFIRDLAKDRDLNQIKQDLADKRGVDPDEIDDDEVLDQAVKEELEFYWGEAPTTATAYIMTADKEYQYDVYYDSGTTEILYDGNLIFQARNLDAAEIKSKIVEHATDNGFITEGNQQTEFSDSDYSSPGGRKYKELLLTLPTTTRPKDRLRKLPDYFEVVQLKPDGSMWRVQSTENIGLSFNAPTEDGAIKAALKYLNDANENYYSGGHFREKNVLAHVRFNERTDNDGNSILFIEEIQSDWAQQGREAKFVGEPYAKGDRVRLSSGVNVNGRESFTSGYMWVHEVKENGELVVGPRKTKAVDLITVDQGSVKAFDTRDRRRLPAAPFVQKTDAWTALAVKRMIRYAAETGFDKIAWTAGDVQNERWTSKYRQTITEISWETMAHDGAVAVQVEGSYDNLTLLFLDGVLERDYNENLKAGSTLASVFGKEVAGKIEAAPEGAIKGDDLGVGLEGFRYYYDSILPKHFNNIGKQYGVKSQPGNVPIYPMSGLQKKQLASGKWIATFAMNGYGKRLEADTEAALDELISEVGNRKNNTISSHIIELTPQLKQAVLKGLPLFKPNASGVRVIKADVQLSQDRLIEAIRQRLKDVGIADRISLNLVDRVTRWIGGRMMDADGAYFNRMIEVAMDIEAGLENPQLMVMNHEIIHALRDLGVFTKDEWSMLSKHAANEIIDVNGVPMRRIDEIRQRYKKAKHYTEDMLIEEAVADSFSEWARERRLEVASPIKRLFRKMVALLRELGRSFKSIGYKSAEDLFVGIDEGMIGRRGGQAETTVSENEALSLPDNNNENFKRWFGNSKVVDSDGRPMVVYRGESTTVEEYKKSKLGATLGGSMRKAGFFFTANNEEAGFYARMRGTNIVTSAYLSIQNPLIVDGKTWKELADWGRLPEQKYKTLAAATKAANKLVADAKAAGHDGLFLQNMDGSIAEYVAFEPTQIKSVSNIGTYSASDPRIKFSLPTKDRQAGVEEGEMGVEADLEGLMAVLGHKLYDGRIDRITYKELLQNSFDAVKMGYADGTIKPGEGKIDIGINAPERSIRFTDNGSGMSRDVVQRALLTIAGTHKGDLDEAERSGGFGIAKMAFIFANEGLEVTTVRDGRKTSFSTNAAELLKGKTKVTTTDTTEPNGTTIKVVLRKTYMQNGEPQELDIDVSPEILRSPLIGDVKVTRTITRKRWDSDETWDDSDTLALGSDQELPPRTMDVKFNWGTMEVYFEPQEYASDVAVLSSGLFQFRRTFAKRLGSYESMPGRWILNVKPNVPAHHELYPFNNQRENFAKNVQADIDALVDIFRAEYNSALSAQYGEIFASANVMPYIERGSTGSGTTELTEPLDLQRFLPKAMTFKAPPVVNIKGGKADVDTAAFAKREKFSVPEGAVPTDRPLFLSNLNQDIVSIVGQVHGVERTNFFVQRLGSIVLRFAKGLGNVQGYEAFRDKRSVGIFFDKENNGATQGVNLVVPYPAFLVNPFGPFARSVKSQRAIASSIMHTMMHEAAHETERNHYESFTQAMSWLYARYNDENLGYTTMDVEADIMELIDENREIYDALLSVYLDPDVQNIKTGEASIGGFKNAVYGSGDGLPQTARSLPSEKRGTEGQRGATDSGLDGQRGGRGSAGERFALAGRPISARAPSPANQPIAGTKKPIDRWYTNWSNKVIDRVQKRYLWRFMALGQLPDQKQYLIKRYETLGKIADIDAVVRSLHGVLSKANPAEAKAIYDYLTTRGASASTVPEKFRQAAQATKAKIDSIGKELVKRKLIPQESYQKYAGTYLPRLYLKHIMGESNMILLGTGKKPSDMGYTKARDETLSEETRMLILGEITDPAFLGAQGIAIPMRDMAILDFFGEIKKNPNWVAPAGLVEWRGETVSAMWLQHESERVAIMAAEHFDGQRQADALKLSKEMYDTASQALRNLVNDIKTSEDWRQVPDTKRYGTLRGIWIRKEIYDDLIGATRILPGDASAMEQILGEGGAVTRFTQLWKMGKTVLNPSTHFRNAMSNMLLLQIGGLPFRRMIQALTKAGHQMSTGGKYWNIAKKYGVNAATFSVSELNNMNIMLSELKAKEGGDWQKILHVARQIGDTASMTYQFWETWMKTAYIIDAMENRGMSEADAAIAAHEAIFDYSLVPPSIRYLRNAPLGSPFITFMWKATGQIARGFFQNPVRLAPYVIFSLLWESLLEMELDVDDDDIEKLLKAMPEWLQKKGHMYLFPYKDQHGRWQVIDFGYLFPWSFWTQAYKAAKDGDIKALYGITGITGGPVPDIISALSTGIDPFTNRKFMDERDPPGKQMLDLMNYVWRMAAPTMLTDVGVAGKVIDALGPLPVDKNGDPTLTPGHIGLRAFGINVYPIDPDKTRARNLEYMRYEIQALKARNTQFQKDQSMSEQDRAAMADYYALEIQKAADRMALYAEESDFPEKLAGGN